MRQASAKPPICVVAGPPHSAKTARVIAAFRESLASGVEAALVLPSAHAASSLRTALLLDGTFDFLGGPRILTFVQFAAGVLEKHAPGVQPIQPMVEDELLARIITDLAREGKISYHRRVLDFRGFVRAVRDFLMELKRAEITEDAFDRFARRKSATSKDRELSAVYSRYQGTLHDLDLYDEEGRFWRAKQLVSEGKLGPFAELRRLFLDGFYDFTPTQLGLVEVLARRGVEVTMTLPLERPSKRAELFESAESTLAKLEERFDVSLQLLPAQRAAEPVLHWLTEHLFDPVTPPGAPEPASIRLIETPGTAAEVREIAREIKRLHLEENIPLEEFAVVFRGLGEYRDVVEEVFEEFGLPVRIGRGVRLGLTPIGQLVLQVLRVPAGGWHARDVMSLLKSNYVDASDLGLGEDALPVVRFEELVTESGTIRGRPGWTRNLRSLRARVESQAESADAEIDDEVRQRTGVEELGRKCRDIERAGTACEKLFECLAALENAKTSTQMVRALLDVLTRLKVEERLLGPVQQDIAARDLESMAAVRECLTSVVRTAAIVREEGTTLADFVRNLRMVFADKTVARQRTDFGRVHVLEVHDVRALSYEVVFIGGLLERIFPRMHREEPFYDDRQRERMSRQGLDIPPKRLSQREERFLFYLAATRARRRLYLSYPVTDREGKEKLVSYYVGEVRRIFAPHELSCRKVTLSTKVVGIDESASRQELRRATVLRLAESRLSRPAVVMSAAALVAAAERRTALVVRRALAGEAERDSWDYFGVHDGVLSHPEALKGLAARFGKDHPFSVTRLEQYGCCPFAFFCSSVLGIEAPPEPPEELEPVDEGTILHRTLREFFSERRGRSEDTRIGEGEVAAAVERICEIADRHLDRFRGRNPDVNEGLFMLQRERLREVMTRFVEVEAERQRDDRLGMTPRFFEVVFGLPVNPKAADPLSTPKRLVVEIQGKPPAGIVGKIDRIDVTTLPGKEMRGSGFRVIDYKRGEPGGGTREIEEGTALQMPVYLLAARDVLFAGKAAEPVDALFYGLGRMKIRAAISRLKATGRGVEEVAGWEELMETTLDAIRSYVGAIRAGDFPVMRRGREACPAYCEFRTICRYGELRARKKLGQYKPWFGAAKDGTDE